MANTRKTYKKLSRVETFAICKQLEKVVIKNDDGSGTCSYVEGWDDVRVAKEIIPDYPGNGAASVGTIRVELFGALTPNPWRKAEDIAALTKRVERLEQDLSDLRARLGEPRKAAVFSKRKL